MKKRSLSWLAASLLVLTVSQSASAQDTPDVDAEQAAPASTEDTAAQPAADDAQASDEGEQDAPADAPAAAAAGVGAGAPTGPVTGPGGKPLREDYSGTEESKQARMDTERIEGLVFNEGETADDVYDLRIRELETKVDDLKETVFRSKTRIVLLKETVLNGTISGSRAIVSHLNELGSTYVLEHARYSLDGSRIFNEQNKNSSLSDRTQFDVYKGAITPGIHRISVLMEFKGAGYKLFSYMDGYRFRVQDSCEFTAQGCRGVTVQVRLYEKGVALAIYQDALVVDCAVNLLALANAEVVYAKADVSTDPAAAAVESAPEAP